MSASCIYAVYHRFTPALLHGCCTLLASKHMAPLLPALAQAGSLTCPPEPLGVLHALIL
jgi:hypothetical protein